MYTNVQYNKMAIISKQQQQQKKQGKKKIKWDNEASSPQGSCLKREALVSQGCKNLWDFK